ncbi:MAG TPA: alpha/beta hydrolase family protein [Candidatus Binatia bacterium]|nr:alpha/beta hydrolase family protein [Candidatus Binatia bacterium]
MLPRPGRLLSLCALVLATLARATDAASPAFHDGFGIHVESAEALDPRQLAVHVSTAALQHPVDVRILVPDDYDANPKKRYPVLYLFHGTSGRASDWVMFGHAEETTAGLPLIVVMPDAGFDGDGGGWFTDWYNGGAGGQPMWETYHVGQLIPWIDDNLRTIVARRGRAIAGLSQGGFGSLSYAARHPELFTSAAAFSGGCVIDGDPDAIAVSTSIIQYTTTVLDGVADQDAIFGPRATEELNWQAHDPGTLVGNLRGMQIALWTGDGTPGPLDPTPVDPVAAAIEKITFGATMRFDHDLTAAGIKHAYHYYGGGTHIFAYWARDLTEYVPTMMRRFRHPGKDPSVVSYRAAADPWAQWGWTVELMRPEPAFSVLDRARRTGFILTGTGTARVTTPAVYRVGAKFRVVVESVSGSIPIKAVVDDDRRVRIDVPLSTGTDPATVRVAIRSGG